MPFSPYSIRIMSTSSLWQSGLSARLISAFQAYQSAYTVQSWSGMGSGAAMDAARRGEADLVCTHDRIGEFIFMAERYALVRQWFSYNYFVIVGKPNGPIAGPTTLQSAFTLINTPPAGSSLVFVSRGPSGVSGTYVRENQIWKRLNIATPNNVVNATPLVGMMGTIQDTYDRIVRGENAYTMTDIGTWYQFLALNRGAASVMTMLTSPNDLTTDVPPRDPLASNQYVAMPVVPDYACFNGQNPPPQINTAGAQAFLDWLRTTTGANNAKDAVNGYLINISPDPINNPILKQGFIYNTDATEHFPDDKCLIKPIKEHGQEN